MSSRHAGPSGAAFTPTLEERRLAISLLERAEVAHLRTALLTLARRVDDLLRGHAIEDPLPLGRAER